jgi:hypothetical protein
MHEKQVLREQATGNRQSWTCENARFRAFLLHNHTMLEGKAAVVELVEKRSNALAIYMSSY